MPQSQHTSFKTYIALITTLALWATAFVGIRIALHSYTPLNLTLLRCISASTVLIIYAFLVKMPLPNKRDLPLLTVCGFLGITLYHLVLNLGEVKVQAGVAALLINTNPIFTGILAVIFLRERMKKAGWLGILIGFVGTTIVALRNGVGNIDLYALSLVGGAVLWSMYSVLQKSIVHRIEPLRITTYTICIGTLLLMPLAVHFPEAVQKASIIDTMAGVYLGIFPTAIAYFTWTYTLSRMTASRASSYLFLVPVLSALLALFTIHEAFTLQIAFGMAITLVGVYIVNQNRRK